MSLFSHNEICEGCIHAVFHTCCNNFCRCKEGHEQEVDHIKCECEYKSEEEKEEENL